jgi:hypothetical protein
MLSKLLGVSNQSDTVGLEETRMRAATLLSKVLYVWKTHSLSTRCHHFVTRLVRPTDSQQVVPTSLIYARNKLLTGWWQQARSNLLRTACFSLFGTTCSSKSVTVINLVTRWEQLVPDLAQQLGTSSANTSWYRFDNNLVTTCLQICNNLHVLRVQ